MASRMRWGAFTMIAREARSAARPGSPSLTSRLLSLPRLIRGVLRGQYPGSSTGRLLAMALAVVYLVSPVDLVPEAFVPLIGLADDAVVIAWLAAALNRETEAFLGWERNRQTTVASTVV